MTNDLDRDLREIFHRHDADMAGRGLTPPPNLTRRTRRRQAATLFLVSVAAVAVAVAGIAGLDAIRASDRRPADQGPRPAPRIDWGIVPGPTIDGDAIVDIASGEVTALPAAIAELSSPQGYAISPSGDALVFEANEGGSSNNPFTTCGGGQEAPHPTCQIFVANADGSDLRQLTDAPGGASAGGWSPDGTSIVAVVDRDTGGLDVDLVLIDVTTGETSRLASGPAGDFQLPHVSADGRQVLFSRMHKLRLDGPDYGTDLLGIPVDGGEATLVFENRWNATFSPDGRTMAYTQWIFIESPRVYPTVASNGGGGGPQLWLADADGSDPRPLLQEEGFSDNPSWSPDGSRLTFSRYGRQRGIVVLDVRSGMPTFFIRTSGDPSGIWIGDHTLLVDV